MSLQDGFIVKSITRTRRKLWNQYTGEKLDPNPYWRVTLRADWIPDRYAELWYNSEAAADRIPKGSISISQLFGAMQSSSLTYILQSVRQEEKWRQVNPYTDRPEFKDSWGASFATAGPLGDIGNMPFVDLWYPNSAEASLWSMVHPYKPLDFLRLFHVLVVYVAAFSNFIAENFSQGFFDAHSYHKPGNYPAGSYPARIYPAGTLTFLEKPDFIVARKSGTLLSLNGAWAIIELTDGSVETVQL